MRDVTNNNFGHLIAYVIPGLTVLWGASHFSPTLQSWLTTNPSDLPTVGGFLYLTLGSVTAGMIVSTVRWLIIDGVHHATGLTEPRWDFSQLARRVDAFESLIRIHYQFYQFNANMLVAIVFAYAVWKSTSPGEIAMIGWEDAAWLLAAVIFFAGSRDTLRRYYLRVEGVLGRQEQDNG